MITESLIERIKRGREGKSHGFPIGLPKLEQYVDGIIKGTYTLIFAESGVGKSSMMLYSYIYRPIMDHLDDGKFKISLFSLEMNADMIMCKLLSTYIFEKFGVRLSLKQILSIQKDYILDDDNFGIVEQCIPWMQKVEKILVIYDKTATAKSIYAALMKEMEAEGTFKEDDKRKIYIPNDPDLVHQVVIDHLGRVQPTEGDLKKEMDKTSKFLYTIKNMCGLAITVIQQSNRNIQSMERRKQGMVLPLSSDLKDTNSTFEDSEICFAIFSPNRAKLATHNGYDIKTLGDKFRSIVLIKGRYGEADVEDAVYYDGKCNKWVELPKPAEIYDYEKILDPRWYLKEKQTDIKEENEIQKTTQTSKFIL